MARAPLHLLVLAALLASSAAQRANFTLTLSALRPADPLSRTSPRIIGTNLGAPPGPGRSAQRGGLACHA